MFNGLLIQLNGLAGLVHDLFNAVFPEYPFAGILVTVLSFLLFLFYAFKSGFYEGAKTSLFVWIILVIVLFCVHHLAVLFTPH